MTSISVNVKHKLAGYFRICVTDTTTGNMKEDTGWFKNLITNQGLDFVAVPPSTIYWSNILNTHCSVGTGNTTPAYTDTQLTSFLSVYPATYIPSVNSFSTSAYVPGPPAYWTGTKVYNFATGAVVGNIAEVGVGNMTSTDTQPQLYSHSLIMISGVPGTISLTATDALTVYYEARIYLDLTDNTYSFNIGVTTYSGTYRRALITSVPPFYYAVGYNPSYVGMFTYAYNGTIDVVTSEPTGTKTGGPTSTSNVLTTYVNGSSYQQVSSTYATTVGNMTGGITALLTTSNHGSYQFSVSPDIPKTSSYSLTLNWSVSWARY